MRKRTGMWSSSDERSFPPQELLRKTHSEDFATFAEKVFNTDDGSDFEAIVEGKSIKLHKFV